MQNSWDGKDRRNGDGKDHDLLIRIDSNLSQLLENFKIHLLDDKLNFTAQDERIKKLEKAYWVGVGVIIVLNIFFNIYIK